MNGMFRYAPSGDGDLYSQRGVSAQKEEVHGAVFDGDIGNFFFLKTFWEMLTDFDLFCTIN